MSELTQSIRTATQLQAELKRLSGKVATYSIDEMSGKLSDLAEVAGNLVERIKAESEPQEDFLSQGED